MSHISKHIEIVEFPKNKFAHLLIEPLKWLVHIKGLRDCAHAWSVKGGEITESVRHMYSISHVCQLHD